MQWVSREFICFFLKAAVLLHFPNEQPPTCLKTLDSKPKASSELIRHTNGICSKEPKYIMGS